MSPEAGGRTPSPETVQKTRVKEPSYNHEYILGGLEKAVIVSGDSHVGKQKITEELGKLLGLPVQRGQGEFSRRTSGAEERETRTVKTHRKFDSKQRRAFSHTTAGNAQIWETRLGGINLAEVRDQRDDAENRRKNLARIGKAPGTPLPEIPAISVLITADRKSRIRRTQKEAWEKEGRRISQEQAKDEMDARVKDNIDVWKQFHPSRYVSDTVDPFDSNLQRPHNRGPVYDIVISNNDVDGIPERAAIEHVVMVLIERLREFGAFGDFTIGEPIIGRPNKEEVVNQAV